MPTLKALCANVRITLEGSPKLSWEKQDTWQKEANGYRVKLSYQGRSYSWDFWQGRMVTKDPTAEGVMECLLSDASSADQGFSDWCSDLGMNEDSRKAEATYQACKAVALSLRRLLGKDYDRFQSSER